MTNKTTQAINKFIQENERSARRENVNCMVIPSQLVEEFFLDEEYPPEVSVFDVLSCKPLIATLVNNNEAGRLKIIETAPNVTIPVGTKMIVCPHPNVSHDCCTWCGLNIASNRLIPITNQPSQTLCEDCPPVGYPTDKTRCEPCPRRLNPTAVFKE